MDPKHAEPSYKIEYDPAEARKIAEKFYPFFSKFFRFQLKGLENLPQGPFLMVSNHNGGLMAMDGFLLLARYLLENRKPPLLVLTHDGISFFAKTPLGRFLAKGGVIHANFADAKSALANGYSLLVYPGGDLDTNRPFSERNKVNFYGHKGYVKLALETQTPIVPHLTIGGHEQMVVLSNLRSIAHALNLDRAFHIHTVPFSFQLPWGFTVGHWPYFPLPAQISSSILHPFYLDSFLPEDAHNDDIVAKIDHEVRFRMQKEMDRLARGRIPFLGKLFD